MTLTTKGVTTLPGRREMPMATTTVGLTKVLLTAATILLSVISTLQSVISTLQLKLGAAAENGMDMILVLSHSGPTSLSKTKTFTTDLTAIKRMKMLVIMT